MAKTEFESYVMEECERQWNDVQSGIGGLPEWKDIPQERKDEFYQDMYTQKSEERASEVLRDFNSPDAVTAFNNLSHEMIKDLAGELLGTEGIGGLADNDKIKEELYTEISSYDCNLDNADFEVTAERYSELRESGVSVTESLSIIAEENEKAEEKA